MARLKEKTEELVRIADIINNTVRGHSRVA